MSKKHIVKNIFALYPSKSGLMNKHTVKHMNKHIVKHIVGLFTHMFAHHVRLARREKTHANQPVSTTEPAVVDRQPKS